MNYYTVRFYYGSEFVAAGHGKAEDEYDAEMKAEFCMMFHRPNAKYDRVEVTDEGKEFDYV
jgi:hypothetical protein